MIYAANIQNRRRHVRDQHLASGKAASSVGNLGAENEYPPQAPDISETAFHFS
jgi:hypothetical protein